MSTFDNGESKIRQVIDDLVASIDGAVKTLLTKIENISSVGRTELAQIKQLLNVIEEGRANIDYEINTFVNTLSSYNGSLTVTLEKMTSDAIKRIEQKHLEFISQTNNASSTLRKDFFQKLLESNQKLEKKIQQNQQQLLEMKAAYEVSKNTEWPKGSYCIFANGVCPMGFERFSGQLRSTFTISSSYGSNDFPESLFGSSSIKYHGGKGNWVGLLTLFTYCK